MNREVISAKQGISIIFIFLIGTTSIVVMGLKAKQDLWLAIILSMFMTVPMVLIYARLNSIFPSKDLFNIFEICFGKLIGKTISILYTLYGLYVGASVLWVISEFINIVSFNITPKIVVSIVMIILSIFITKEGIEVMGRYSNFFAIIISIIMFIAILLLIPKMKINNIQPVLSEGIKPILQGAYSAFTFPFGQIVILSMFFTTFEIKKSAYKVYAIGVLLGGVMVLAISLTDILVIGVNEASSVYFPTYNAVTIIDIRSIIQSIEIVLSITFIIGAFLKLSIYLLAICRGFATIFEYTEYRFVVTPVALLILNLSYYVYESMVYYSEWVDKVWTYASFPFQVIFPIIIWMGAEIKKKQLIKLKKVFC